MGTTIFVILSVLKFFFIPPLSLEMKSELKIIPTTTSYLTLLESGHIFWGVVYIPSIRISCITKKSQLFDFLASAWSQFVVKKHFTADPSWLVRQKVFFNFEKFLPRFVLVSSKAEVPELICKLLIKQFQFLQLKS